MGTFWIAAVLLSLLAMLCVVLPLRRRAEQLELTDDIALRENVTLYRERMAELQNDLRRGALDQVQHDALAAELARTLLADAAVRKAQAALSRQGRGVVLALVLLLPVATIATYLHLGAMNDWRISELMKKMAGMPPSMAAPLRDELAQRVKEQLERKPDNLHYRVLLARFYMAQDDYDAAQLQYRFLAEMLPEDDEAQAYFAQSLYLANQRDITPEVQAAIDRALAINPHNATVLGMVGINAFERGDYRKAIDAWQKVIAALPADNENARMLGQGIERAKQKLAERGEAWEPPKADVVATGEGISVSVTVDAAVTASPEQSVFIYAKAAQGPKMPLAVQRLTVRQLPATVTLTDAMAMMPAMKLSSFDEVVVGARISQSGQAIAGPGDWVGESAPLKWRDQQGTLAISISKQIP